MPYSPPDRDELREMVLADSRARLPEMDVSEGSPEYHLHTVPANAAVAASGYAKGQHRAIMALYATGDDLSTLASLWGLSRREAVGAAGGTLTVGVTTATGSWLITQQFQTADGETYVATSAGSWSGSPATVEIPFEAVGTGAATLAADVNGLSMKVPHISRKITEMMMHAETGYGCALGAAANAVQHPSGVWLPDPLITNAGLNTIRSTVGKHLEYLHDIGGGLVATMPTEADWENPELRKYIEPALRGNPKYSTEERLRALNLVQDLAASRATGTILGFTVNAAGSPATNEVAIKRMYDLDKRVQYAKEISGIRN